MRNSFLKGAHLSEQSVDQIIRCFCEDLTATEISAQTGISRITINNYLKLIRHRICLSDNTGHSFSHYHPEVEDCFFGTSWRKERINIAPLESELCRELKQWKEGKADRSPEEKFPVLASFHAFIDPSEWRLRKITTIRFTENDNNSAEEIDAFWSLTRKRLLKFRGINRKNAFLHLNESAFRFNHRHRDLYEQVRRLFNRTTSTPR